MHADVNLKEIPLPLKLKEILVLLVYWDLEICTQDVHKDNETSGRTSETNGDLSSNIPVRYIADASFKRGTFTTSSLCGQLFKALGLIVNLEKS